MQCTVSDSYQSELQVFVVAAYFNLLAHTMCGMFVRGFAEICEAFVSIRRLQVSVPTSSHIIVHYQTLYHRESVPDHCS